MRPSRPILPVQFFCPALQVPARVRGDPDWFRYTGSASGLRAVDQSEGFKKTRQSVHDLATIRQNTCDPQIKADPRVGEKNRTCIEPPGSTRKLCGSSRRERGRETVAVLLPCLLAPSSFLQRAPQLAINFHRPN